VLGLLIMTHSFFLLIIDKNSTRLSKIQAQYIAITLQILFKLEMEQIFTCAVLLIKQVTIAQWMEDFGSLKMLMAFLHY
jgi:hypothetical protein